MVQMIKKNYTVLGICFIASFVTLLFFAISVSPLALFEGYDSCVFKQMGLAILQGKTPYVDLFDHKGPILYLVNALGLWIGGRWGLFSLCVLNFTFVLYYWKKIACLYVSDVASIFVILLTIAMYITIMDEGNLTEDWSLLPLSYSLYLSLWMQKDGHIPSKMESYLIGVSAGVILFIRANNVAVLLCAFVLILYLLLRKKTYRGLINVLVCAFGGIISVTSIVLSFFYYRYGQNGMEQMIYGSFVFNFTSYSTYYLRVNSVKEYVIANISFFFLNYKEIYRLFFLFGIVLCIYGYINNRDNKQNKTITLFMVGSFFFCFYTLGRNAFEHYLISILPLYVFATCYAFKNSINKYLLCSFIFVFCSLTYIYDHIGHVMFSQKKEDVLFYQKTDEFVSSTKNFEKLNIWNYNAGFKGIDFLQRYNITQCNRIILPFQLILSDYLRKTDINKLELVTPQYILLCPIDTYHSNEDSIYINQNYIRKDSISPSLLILKYHNK